MTARPSRTPDPALGFREKSARVCHIYDHSAMGLLVAGNRDDAVVNVVWDARPGVLHPCIRAELITSDALAERAHRKRLKRAKLRDQDRDYNDRNDRD